MDAAVEALDLLGSGQALNSKEHSSRELRRAIERGLPRASAKNLMQFVPVQRRKEWTALLLSGPGDADLSLIESERAGRLAYVLALSKEVWGDWTRAKSFLSKSHPLLDGQSPLEAARTEWGGREVEKILRKIQFGLPV